jgi:hypothetical protein
MPISEITENGIMKKEFILIIMRGRKHNNNARKLKNNEKRKF